MASLSAEYLKELGILNSTMTNNTETPATASSSSPKMDPNSNAATTAGTGGGENSGEPVMSKKQQKKLAKEAEKAEKKGAKAGNNSNTGSTSTMIDLNPPSGTRDFFPAEMRAETWLFNKFIGTAERFGFERYDCPVLEHSVLYDRKAGEEIRDQMYCFTDKEGAEVTLRPEMTPSLARLVLNLMREETGQMSALLPLKWYSIPQCWRFETCQKGRKREHYQWNMDMVGVDNITCEVELLAAVVDFFTSCGLSSKEIKIKVNSRKVLGAVLSKAGVSDSDFAAATVIIDKSDKIGTTEVKKQLVETLNMPVDVASKIVDATGAPTLQEFAKVAGASDSEEVKELQELFELAKDYGTGDEKTGGVLADWLVFDASVVRGLAYYTGIVFEGADRAGEFRAICGGGRYDKLLQVYGSNTPIPMCGFGFGDCVIMLLLEKYNCLPLKQFEKPEIDYLVCSYSKELLGASMKCASILRSLNNNNKVNVFQGVAKKIGKMFSYADRVGARRVLMVAPDEWSRGEVVIKDLREEDEGKKQRTIPVDKLGEIDSYFK